MVMARMRTIKQIAEYFKQQDPDTAFREHCIRQMVKSGKLKAHKAGVKYLLDLDSVIEALKNPSTDEEEKSSVSGYGTLRKVF